MGMPLGAFPSQGSSVIGQTTPSQVVQNAPEVNRQAMVDALQSRR